MKKYFAVLMVVAGLLAVSCGKDNNGGGSTKDPQTQDDSNLPASLKGTNYFPIIIDEESGNAIASKIVCDLRPDDVNKHLYIWNAGETYSAGEASGTNFYGKLGYLNLICVAPQSWSGGGFNIAATADNLDKFADIAANPDKYYFHIAYKGNAGDAHLIQVSGFSGNPYEFAIGEGSVEVGNPPVKYDAVAPKDGAFEAGEWVEYEFSVQEMGLNFGGSFPAGGINILCFLSGNNPGAELSLDAAFFYKK